MTAAPVPTNSGGHGLCHICVKDADAWGWGQCSTGAMARHSSISTSQPDGWMCSQDYRPLLPSCFRFEGFRTKHFNETFVAKQAAEVNGRPTYWDPPGAHFIYWQKTRWALCPRFDEMSNQDLLACVQNGGVRGLAYEVSEEDARGSWMEYTERGFRRTKGIRLREEPRHPGRRGWKRSRRQAPPKVGDDLLGKAPASLEEMKRLLEAQPEVEEVFVVRENRGEAGLVVSFRRPCAAAEALEVGRGLLNCDPDVIDPLTGEDAARLLELSEGGFRPHLARSTALPQDKGEEDSAPEAPKRIRRFTTARPKSKASPVRAAEATASEAPPKQEEHSPAAGHPPAALPAPPPATDTVRHPSPEPAAADAAEPLDAPEGLSYWEPQEIDMQELLLQQERNQAMEEFEQPGERDLAEPKTMDVDMDSPKEFERTITPAEEREPRPAQGSSWEPAIGEALEKLMVLASTVTPEVPEQVRQQKPDEVPADEQTGGATAVAAASEKGVTTSLGHPEGAGSPPVGPTEKARKPKGKKVRSCPQEPLPEEPLAAPAAGSLAEKTESGSGLIRPGEVGCSSQDKAAEERAVSPGASVAAPSPEDTGQSAGPGSIHDKVKKTKDKKEKKAEKAQRKRELKERLRREVEEELRLEEARRTAGPSHRPKWRPEFFAEVHLDEAPRS